MKMQDAATAVNSGSWIAYEKFAKASIEVFGTFTGTLKLYASNQDQPAPTAGIQVGADITAPGLATISSPYKWIRLAVTAFTAESGSVSAAIQMLSET